MSGFIKIHRTILDSSTYKQLNSSQRDVMFTCLLMVNWKENEWLWNGEMFKCKPGQMITSLQSIAKNCGKNVKVQSVRTALLKLEKMQFLTNTSTKSGRLITICKWESYQQKEVENNKDSNKELTKNQQRANKELTTIEEGKEGKEGKPQLSVEETFNLFWDRYHELTGHPKNNKKPAFKYWKKLTLEQRRKAYNKIPLYAKTNETKYLKIARTYLSDETFNDELVSVNESKTDIESPRMYVKNHLTYGQLIGKEPIRSDKYPEYNGLFYHQLKDEFLKPKK